MSTVAVFDGGVLAAGPITGVGRAFLHALAAFGAVRPARLLVPPGTEVPELPGVDLVATSTVAGAVARRVALPRALRRLAARVLHAPVAAIPWRAPCPIVATVHDLPWRADVRLGERSTCGVRHRLAVRIAARRAAVVIVPSHATAQDLLRDVPAPRAALEVVPHGVPLPPAAAPEREHDGPFVVLGDRRPRKNLARVRRAHAVARARVADLPPLELVGPGTRWIGEDDKHALLRRARALLQVSLHEGFGLPVVEAFGHGTPVVCSTAKSLPEVAGGAALLVDACDERAIADAIVRVHVDPDARARLAAAGRERAALLTPERTAARWMEIHDRIAR